MEEDIKLLEPQIKACKECKYKSCEQCLSDREKIQAIENLIARYKELETIVKTYNAIPNDYMSNDVKIVIADREYFNNGIFKENYIPKSKVKEKIEELNKEYEKISKENFINKNETQKVLNAQIVAYKKLLED